MTIIVEPPLLPPPAPGGRRPRRAVRPPLPPDVGPLGRLAALTYRNRGRVLLAWLAALALSVGLASVVSGEFTADYSAVGSDSAVAQELLSARFPAQAGQTVDVVVQSASGAVPRERVERLFVELGAAEHVKAVQTPYEGGAVSADGRVALGQLRLDVANAADLPAGAASQLLQVAAAAERPDLRIALGGEVIGAAEAGSLNSELVGVVAAALVLLLALGSVVAAGLPIIVALTGVGVSLTLIPVLAATGSVPDWSTSLAAMLGLGIGIDYVLLLLTRYREWRTAGLEPYPATVATLDTAGRAVMVAGGTVLISMLGLFAMGLSYMRGAALAAIVTVGVVMLGAATLLPALLGYAGARTEALMVRLPTRRSRRGRAPVSRQVWVRWARLIGRHRLVAAAVGLGLLVLLASPLTGVRFGFPDAGNDRAGTSTRLAYDGIAAGFGPGANAPLLVTATVPAGTAGALAPLSAALSADPGVASVSPVALNPAGDTAVLTVVPTTGPQDRRTEALVRHLRKQVLPAAGGPLTVHVGGVTAVAIDSTQDVVSRLPLLIGGVVLLSMLLLLVAFRSIAIPLKAAALNLLSVAAAYGVVAYVLQGGWAGQLLGIDSPTPLPAFIPVLMFAILFGLSMDYEVFLLSRMRESWVRDGDVEGSVDTGLAATGAVITAAATIMVVVFGAFVPDPELFLKIIGVGLAAAILIDATVVRMVLVPAAMLLLGERAWWLPSGLARVLPELHLEGRPALYAPPPTPGPAPVGAALVSGLGGQRPAPDARRSVERPPVGATAARTTGS